MIWMMKSSGTKPKKMLKSLFREFISLKSLVLIILQKYMCAWEVGIINIMPKMQVTLQQIWTCQRMTVLNWLKRQLMRLIMPVYENCSSPLKRTTLIFAVKMEWSEYHIKMLIFKCWKSQFSSHALQLLTTSFDEVFVTVLSKFPHYWVCLTNRFQCI